MTLQNMITAIRSALTPKLPPHNEAMRHELRAEVAALTRVNKVAQRTLLMEEILGRKNASK